MPTLRSLTANLLGPYYDPHSEWFYDQNQRVHTPSSTPIAFPEVAAEYWERYGPTGMRAAAEPA